MELTDTLALLLTHNFMGQSVGIWLGFLGVVLSLMVLDLGILSRRNHIIPPKVSLLYSLFYVMIACLFGAWLWKTLGSESGMDYFTAYTIELSLSLDNLFVMSVILGYFHIPRKYQHKILFWGIMGVLVMRGIMIGSGLIIVEKFGWVLYLFAAFLIFTGIKMLIVSSEEEEEDLKDSRLVQFFQSHLRCTKDIVDDKFFVRAQSEKSGKLTFFATPLFLALICIEFMDVVFALDSVPAVFAISRDPFVVYSSNIFAIIGLRSMYFVVVALLDRFKYMNIALSIVLVFIGGKVFYSGFVSEINHFVSLGITIGLLSAGIIYSLIKTRHEEKN